MIHNVSQVHQIAAQTDDASSEVGSTMQREKKWFPVWDDARGEWTEQDN